MSNTPPGLAASVSGACNRLAAMGWETAQQKVEIKTLKGGEVKRCALRAAQFGLESAGIPVRIFL